MMLKLHKRISAISPDLRDIYSNMFDNNGCLKDLEKEKINLAKINL